MKNEKIDPKGLAFGESGDTASTVSAGQSLGARENIREKRKNFLDLASEYYLKTGTTRFDPTPRSRLR